MCQLLLTVQCHAVCLLFKCKGSVLYLFGFLHSEIHKQFYSCYFDYVNTLWCLLIRCCTAKSSWIFTEEDQLMKHISKHCSRSSVMCTVILNWKKSKIHSIKRGVNDPFNTQTSNVFNAQVSKEKGVHYPACQEQFRLQTCVQQHSSLALITSVVSNTVLWSEEPLGGDSQKKLVEQACLLFIHYLCPWSLQI